jgi:hypothetical protein
MLNAWELLLKARIVKEDNNALRSIEIWEQKTSKSGLPNKRLSPRRNRAGNVMTIGIARAVATVIEYKKDNGLNKRRSDAVEVISYQREHTQKVRSDSVSLFLPPNPFNDLFVRNLKHEHIGHGSEQYVVTKCRRILCQSDQHLAHISRITVPIAR